jgi:hypothetical protein
MKTLFIFLLICALSSFSFAQTTAIPDANFEQALIDLGYDTGVPNGTIPTANINTIGYLQIAGNSITDLTGIEDFTALDWLYCNHNQLTSLDLSQNLLLLTLICHNNQLSSIDISQNSLLNAIGCENNQLNCLNVKNGNNSNFQFINLVNNPNLTCIEVDNVNYSINNWTSVDQGATFSANCNNPCINIPTKISSEKNKYYSIYPNPTNGSINIDLSQTLRKVKTTLTNSLGQVIITKEYSSTDFLSLDIDGPNGIYFLQFQTDNGEVVTKKIIKE